MWKSRQEQGFELQPGDRIATFTLGTKLGEGAVGVVYKATREADGAIVALKILKKQLAKDEVFKARFEHEARAAREVEHPHLVPIVDAGEEGDYNYLAVQFVEGQTLESKIKGSGALAVAEAVDLMAGVAAGLDALHDKGIFHRDIKPSNILIDELGDALLTDFGSAKGAAYTALTSMGQVLGTLDYMAPELIKGAPASASSDIYALACVVFECVVGRSPFGHKSVLQVGLAHMEEDPPDPSEARPEVPASLSWAILQGLAKDPAKRPQTATAYTNMLVMASKDRPRPAG
jgi:serine/threonine-protein kinase